MVKADDKGEFDGEKDNYTHFEELQKRVEILQRVVDEHAEILRQNDLVKTTKIKAPYFDDDEVYKELEDEGGRMLQRKARNLNKTRGNENECD